MSGLLWLKRIEKKKIAEWGNARKIKLCLYVKQMWCHMPAVYNVNYLLNKRNVLLMRSPPVSLAVGVRAFLKNHHVFSCLYLC